MLTLANIISHYRASASPSRGPNCTLWTWLHLAPSVWESGAKVRTTGGRGRRSLTIASGTLRSEGVSFFSRVIFQHWICQRVYASVLICVLSEGGGDFHVLREGLCRWNEKWREGGRPVGKSFPWGARCRWCNRWRGDSESQVRRWSKLSLSSCSFLLKV